METKSELLDNLFKKENGKLFPIKIVFSLDRAGHYKGSATPGSHATEVADLEISGREQVPLLG